MEGNEYKAVLDEKSDNVCIINANGETVYETGVWAENCLDLKPHGAIEPENGCRIYRSPEEKFIISFVDLGESQVVEVLVSTLRTGLHYVEC